jgi:hypothetical protein
MARLPGNTDGDCSVHQNKYSIEADFAELLASSPPAADEFSDPNVHMRVAMIITRAMNRLGKMPSETALSFDRRDSDFTLPR